MATSPVPPYLRVVGAVGLLERLEDDLLLLWEIPIPVSRTDKAITLVARIKDVMIAAPAVLDALIG